MKLWDFSKKASRMAFFTLPSAMLGIRELANNNRLIRDLWRSIKSVRCPECSQGPLRKILELQEVKTEEAAEDKETRQLYNWACDKCGFSFLEEDNYKKVLEQAGRHRAKRFAEAVDGEQLAERDKAMTHFRRMSRIWFTMSLAALSGFAYSVILANSGVFISLNLLVLFILFFQHGLINSYRHWQFATGTFFVQGSFVRWFRKGDWFL